MTIDTTIISSVISATATFLATFCATIPALVALVFTARQLRESVKQSKQLEQSIKSGIYHDIVGAEREVWQTMLANDPTLLKNWLKSVIGFESVDDEGINKQRLFVLHQISFYENLYYQYTTGVFPIEAWNAWKDNMAADFNNVWYQEVWTRAGQWYMKSFREFVEAEFIAPRKNGTMLPSEETC